jgi:CBS domain-containing protein
MPLPIFSPSLKHTAQLIGMGLRHLCVVDARQRVVGIITRKDFLFIPETFDEVS